MARFPAEVLRWLEERGLGQVISANPVSGGCIHQSSVLKTERGERFFLKFNPAAPPGIFFREEEGLRALRVPEGPVIPDVYLAGTDFLLLEDLRPAPRVVDFWTVYGRQLAQVHRQSNPRFGFPEDNYIGSSPQLNGWMENGLDFFRERRLVPQIRWARDKGLLSPADQGRCEKLLGRLAELIPDQPAVLLHGDLWSGNLITDASGNPALIDPAAYYGWAEVDLAMADLFGRYPEPFYQSYLEVNPLQKGFRERFELYNLYHLLNHLNLFGRSYLAGVQNILIRFS